MPTSDFASIASIMSEIYRLQPERMIELGIGFGKYGALCRETLDGMYGRCRPDQWQREIVGVEAWEPYRNPAWGCYSEVLIEDFTEIAVKGWDLVLMVDSLEHLPPEAGAQFLRSLVHENRQVIVSVPNGRMDQDAAYGNPYERHLATYHGHEFDGYRATVLHLGLCRVVSIQG